MKDLAGKTAFVTGASGFVGTNLVRALLARGWHVRALIRAHAPSLEGLEVDTVRMRQNLARTRGSIMAEAVMMELAPRLGRDRAHHLVAEATRRAARDDGELEDALLEDRDLAELYDREALRRLVAAPDDYLGIVDG